MQLARHSDPKLTMARYGRAQLHDLGRAVDRLPTFTGSSATRGPAGTGNRDRFLTGSALTQCFTHRLHKPLMAGVGS